MLWYLLKTWPGREEELIKEIHRTVPPYLYQEAFVIRSERIWRRQGKNILHPELPFPGCVFLTCKETEKLFQRMEMVPAMARLIRTGHLSVFPLAEQDAQFLEMISGEDHMIRLSFVLREGDGRTYRISGPLRDCLSDLDHVEFRKRFVKIRRNLWGEDTVIALGIVLNEDVKQKLICENLEIFVEVPENYLVMEIGRPPSEMVGVMEKGKPSSELAGTKGR